MNTRNILLLSLFVFLIGCSSKEHMEFKSVAINGNVNEFAKELVKLGFTEPQLTGENQIKLTGEILEKSCDIYVYSTKKSQTTYKVRVNLPGEVHDSLEKSFEKIQKLYTAKYGRGISKYQQFKNAERFLFNEPKFTRHITTGDFTKYVTDSGVITMEAMNGYISITFLDKLNNETMISEIVEGARMN
jgi:hypothetical protein